MILMKYALLLFVFCSVGNSGKNAVMHPDGTPKFISLDELKKLQSKITNCEPMPHWPPVKGMLYFTEPSNTVSVESFSTRMS
jgi:hypothetical protein